MNIKQIIPAQPGWHVWLPDDPDPHPVISWALVDVSDPHVTTDEQCVVPMIQRLAKCVEAIALSPADGMTCRLVSPEDSYEYALFDGAIEANKAGWTALALAPSNPDEMEGSEQDHVVLCRKPRANPFYRFEDK